MSLLNTASPWNSSRSDTRRRISAIGKDKRKTQKAPRDEDVDFDDNDEVEVSDSLQNTVALNESRGSTINDLLNKITSTQVGEGLADFKPVVQKDLANPTEGFESPLLKMAAGMPEYGPSGSDNLSNYNKSYEAGAILGKPYYASMGIGGGAASGSDPVLQKLNYITHILEDIQMEKTSNITEELILYSFLGVFIIFVVDSFSKAGKYYR